MRYLEKASQHGDVLVVGVDSDEKIRRRKGPDRPIVDEKERTQMISHVRGVTYITLKQPSETKWELIKAVRPDILIATAETYTSEEVKELEKLYCGKVVVLEPQATTSTSARIRTLNLQSSRKAVDIVRQRFDNGTPRENLWEGLDNVC
jgi:cytidyltransferase-like protein